MSDKNKWHNSWPAIIVCLLTIQLYGHIYIQRLPDAADKYYELAAYIFLYVVFATFIIIRKYELDKKNRLHQRAKQDREKQKLIKRINELEKTVEKLNN